MPKIVFKDQDTRPPQVADGDYIMEVAEANMRMSKSSASEYIELKLKEVNSGAVVYENLVFVDSMQWKIEGFLKAIGYVPKVGETVDFTKEFLAKVVVGARFWAKLGEESYEKDGKKKTRNVVEHIYIDKGVPKRALAKAAPVSASKIDADDVPMDFPKGKSPTQPTKPAW